MAALRARFWGCRLDRYRGLTFLTWISHRVDGPIGIVSTASPWEQAIVVSALDRLARRRRAGGDVWLIQVTQFRGKTCPSLGNLRTADLEAIADARESCGSDVLGFAREFMGLFGEGRLREILPLLDNAPPVLRFLGSAFQRILEELPSTSTGLSRTESQVLMVLREGPAKPGALVLGVVKLEKPSHKWWLGDVGILDVVSRLARFSTPLVRVLAPSVDREGRVVEYAITDAGARALDGQLDHAIVNRISRWVGGAYLFRRPSLRWDPACGTVVGP